MFGSLACVSLCCTKTSGDLFPVILGWDTTGVRTEIAGPGPASGFRMKRVTTSLAPCVYSRTYRVYPWQLVWMIGVGANTAVVS